MTAEMNEEILEVLEDNEINCKSCGKMHEKITSNCCWISCGCGTRICGRCGGSDIVSIDESELDRRDYGDDNYWCCETCNTCELRGCGMCV